METTYPEHKVAIREVCTSGWSLSYPEWVRETFARALKTQVLPPYAEATVNKALRAARSINERLERQAAEADRMVEPKVSARHNQRKADKRARDRELRARMKGTASGKK